MNSQQTGHHTPHLLTAHFCTGLSNASLHPCTAAWDDMADKLLVHEVRDNKDGNGIVWADFTTPHRKRENVTAYHALTLDIEGKTADDLPPAPEVVADRLNALNLEGVVYTSHNHMAPPEINKGKPASPRYRVVVPSSAPILPADLARHTDALASALKLSAWLDPASRVTSQFFYLPSCRPGAPRFATRTQGEAWNPDDLSIQLANEKHTHMDFTPPPVDGGYDAVKKVAAGQWERVLSSLGIHVPANGKHGPCPGCGGHDRFRFDNKDGGGSFICGQGGEGTLSGDGFNLVQHVRHCNAADALALVRDVVMPGAGNGRRTGNAVPRKETGETQANDTQKDEAEAWSVPLPVPDTLKPVAKFNDYLLPESLRQWVADIAERMQCPPDFSAVGAMVALSSVIGRKAAIKPKRYDDWTVIPNLWGVIVGRPGVMKSPALSEVMKPLSRLEIEAAKTYATAVSDFKTSQKLAEMADKHAEKEAQKLVSKGNTQGAKKLLQAQEQDNDQSPPALRRYTVTDTSVEALGETLMDNPHGVLIYRDELDGLLKSMSKEGQEGARAFYLQGYDGNQGYTFDRIMRGKNRRIKAVCLSMLGGIQPGKLQEYIRQANNGGAGDDGLLQRFGLLVWPDVAGEWRNVDRWPDTDAKQRAFDTFKRLDDMAPDTDPDTSEDCPKEYRFSEDAQVLFEEWRQDFETSLRSDEHHPAMESHLSKYRKLIPALALVCALADNEQEVSRDSLLRALAWGEYLQTHAERAYAAGSRPATAGAVALLAKIKAGIVSSGFKPADIYLKGWTRLSTPEEVHAATTLLCDLGHLRRIERGPGAAGGRPSAIFEINPLTNGRG